MCKNDIKILIETEKENICKKIAERMAEVKLSQNKEKIIETMKLHVDVSGLKIHNNVVHIKSIKRKINKIHKNLYGFYPSNISFDLEENTSYVNKIVFDYEEYFLNQLLLDDIYIFSIGFILGILAFAFGISIFSN